MIGRCGQILVSNYASFANPPDPELLGIVLHFSLSQGWELILEHCRGLALVGCNKDSAVRPCKLKCRIPNFVA
jgi:hypothetical protein